MTIFELVKITLDTLYKETCKQHGDGADAQINTHIHNLSNSYSQLNASNRSPVSYKDPATRFAYVYKYVASHSDYIVQVLERTKQDQNTAKIFHNESIRVSCIGGGPGSDIIAILKYLEDCKASEDVKKVTCYLLDREQAWADTWTELDDSLQTNLRLNANFQPLDVTTPESWVQQQKFLEADLFTLSYFVSEVKALDVNGKVSDFWQRLFENAKSSALFLYVDNGHETFNSYFDGQWKKVGFSVFHRLQTKTFPHAPKNRRKF